MTKTFNSVISTPLAIPDDGVSNLEATVNVPDTGVLKDINVMIDIEHTYAADLLIVLKAPDGTETVLAEYYGSVSANFTNTIFDDQASVSIADGTGPFTGLYKPKGLLSELNGKSIKGDWKLVVFDDGSGADTGVLKAFSIELKY